MSLQRFTVIQNSDFNLYNRWLSGESIDPLLQQRQDVGFNSPRIWTAFNIPLIGRLIPREHPDFYRRVPEFMDYVAGYGMYPEWTAFTGPYGGIFDNQAEMIAHWERLDDALNGCTNLLDLEAINEGDNAPNAGVPLDKLRRPTNKNASHGSAVQDAPPMQPVWDVAGHRPGSSQEWRKVGHNPMADVADVFNVPSWCNETVRRPDNDSSWEHAFDAAASATLLCSGSCFHSPSGKNSTLFIGRELQLAQAWTAGARSVPLEYQAGSYRHRSDLENDQILRAYSRVLSDGRECVVTIRY